jgi:hypothetical protein
VAEAATKAGNPDAAMAAAGKVTDPSAQSLAYAAMAEAAAKAGNPDAAMAAAGKVTGPSTQYRTYAAVALAAAIAGNPDAAKAALDAAMAAAGKVTDPSTRSETYQQVALRAAEAGLTELAQEAAKRIPKEWSSYRSTARAAVAQALARAGRLYDARVYCENCEWLDKLKAYTVILTEYTKRHQHPTAPK